MKSTHEGNKHIYEVTDGRLTLLIKAMQKVDAINNAKPLIIEELKSEIKGCQESKNDAQTELDKLKKKRPTKKNKAKIKDLISEITNLSDGIRRLNSKLKKVEEGGLSASVIFDCRDKQTCAECEFRGWLSTHCSELNRPIKFDGELILTEVGCPRWKPHKAIVGGDEQQ